MPTVTPVATVIPSKPQVVWPVEAQFVSAVEGDTVTFAVHVDNAQAYAWLVNRKDGRGYQPLLGENGYQLSFCIGLESNGYEYICRATNAGGMTESPVFTLEVLPALDIPPMGDNVHLLTNMVLLLLSAAGLLCYRRKAKS